jgi:hypothetical protein
MDNTPVATPKPAPYIIRSSHGNVHVRRSTGKVIRIENNRRPSELKGLIDRFDLASAPAHLATLGECDILDIGYWPTKGEYEPKVVGWAAE